MRAPQFTLLTVLLCATGLILFGTVIARSAAAQAAAPIPDGGVRECRVTDDNPNIYELDNQILVEKTGFGYVGYIGYRPECVLYYKGSRWYLAIEGKETFAVRILSGGGRVSGSAQHRQIAGTFDGCDYGRLYPLLGSGILECREYEYFYEYSPHIVADGDRVILIEDEPVNAIIHDGKYVETSIVGEFNGCECGTRYMLSIGRIFECETFSNAYSFSPDVQIFAIEGRRTVVFIDGEEFDGILLGTR